MDPWPETSNTDTRSETIEQDVNTSSTQLPIKSQSRYEVVYKTFMDWRTSNNVDSYSENVLMTYFGQIDKKLKPSSLWAIYSMLRSVISIKHNVNIANYSKLKAFLKKRSVGYKAIKSKILTPEEILAFISKAPNLKYLLTKVILIFGITGACRKQELKNIKITDIEDTGKTLIIKIPDTKTEAFRSFVISGNFYTICKLYIELRHKIEDSSISQFFVNYQKGKCTRQLVGINKIGGTPKQIAEYLKLPNPSTYTGHCFRRTSATILVDAGGNLMALKRPGSWTSPPVAEACVDDPPPSTSFVVIKEENP